jgi:alpha-glucosidase (family GH31 glycosyl hydrolase)
MAGMIETLWTIEDETGKVFLRGKEAGMRDAAFLGYRLIRQGEADSFIPFLRSGGERALRSPSPMDAAYWLWAAGEYLLALPDGRGLSEELQPHLAAAVARIEREWTTPCAHWLDTGRHGLFTSHLAIYYRALQVAGPFAGRDSAETALRAGKAIRELVFAKLLKDGRVVSKLGDTAIDADIVAAAIPFGMFGIEDRILIEALYQVEERLVGKGVRLAANDTFFGGCERPDVTCLLAWYYANKGDLARAKSLLAQVDALYERDGVLYEADTATAAEPLYLAYWQGLRPLEASALSEIVYRLAQEQMLAGAAAAASADGSISGAAVKLLHRPTGYDDPYVILPNERFPRHPEAGDTVTVRLLTQPFHSGRRPQVLVAVNGRLLAAPIQMTVEKTSEGERCWAARLGSFETGDEVAYTFRVNGSGAETQSETYRVNGSGMETQSETFRVNDSGMETQSETFWVNDSRMETQSETFRFAVREWRQLGPIRSVLKKERSVTVAFEPVETGAAVVPVVTFEATEAGPLRIGFRHETPDTAGAPAGSFATGPLAALPVGDSELAVSVTGDGVLHIELHGRDRESRMSGYADAGKQLFEVLTDAKGMVHKLRMNVRSGAHDRWFGTGERYAEYEYSGYDVDHYVYNQYRDQGLKTYMPVPFAVSSGKYGLYIDSPLYSKFRFRTGLTDLVELEADVSPQAQRLDLYVLAGEPMRMTEQFSSLAGKPALPPKWAFGPWMSSNNWDSQAEVLEQLELTKRYEIPSTVLVIEQWSDEATFYIFNDAQYEAKDGNEPFAYGDFRFPAWGRWPDPKRMVQELHDNGLKVLLWQIPIHKFMYGVPHEQRDRDEDALLANGYAVKNADGSPYTLPYNWFKDCHILDFTNPEACDWWFAKRRYLVEEVGVDGFKTDGGEFVFGHDLQFQDGSTGREMRNLYPNLYVGSYYDFVQKHVPGGGITFSRAGYTGAQRYPLHWAGDERSTYAAFRSSMIAGLTSGMAGIVFWGWDLAGFHGDIPSAELFIRSAQMAAFCPVMQYHAETKGEFNQDRTPWNIAERTGNPDAIRLYKRYADLRMNLLPYVYREAIESHQTGKPMMRAMLLAFPDDPRCTEMISQYMFGDSLLVAPVMDEGATAKQVYFPEGSWISLCGSMEAEGPAYATVRAELADIPVFIRQDRIVPLNLGRDLRPGSHVGNRIDRYERLSFHVYVKSEARLAFEDDLGTKLILTAVRDTDRLLLEWSGVPEEGLVAVVRGQKRAAAVAVAVVQGQKGAAAVAVADGGHPYSEARSKEELKPGMFIREVNDLYVCVGQGSGRLAVTDA